MTINNINDLWITDEMPEESGFYLVTFHAKHKDPYFDFRGIDLVEFERNEDGKAIWYTQDIEKRFRHAEHIRITAWMDSPDPSEEL